MDYADLYVIKFFPSLQNPIYMYIVPFISIIYSNSLWNDRILLHAPYGGREGREGAWRALVEAQRAGKTRSIGVSNYGVHHLDELEEYNKNIGGKIDVGQYELHPWLGRQDIVEWLQKRNVVVEAYSPLVQATKMNDPSLQALVKKHNKTPAQVLLRWSLQKVRWLPPLQSTMVVVCKMISLMLMF